MDGEKLQTSDVTQMLNNSLTSNKLTFWIKSELRSNCKINKIEKKIMEIKYSQLHFKSLRT